MRWGPGRMLGGRERLQRLLEHAGNPHLAVPSILVGGTNGKGRVVAALSAVLSCCYRTGAFIKPHLKSIRERWRINDADVYESLFITCANRTCDLIAEHKEQISFFEANVLLGSLIFQASNCEIAIWEVGLGGREDACNLVDPLLSILTNVGYDHQAILGNTLSEIARDKAHICRRNRTLILGSPRPGWESAYAEYQPVVDEVCLEHGASLHLVALPHPANWESYIGNQCHGLPPDTLAITRTTLSHLATLGYSIDDTADETLLRVRYRGRMEHCELRGSPVLLDAAHNVDSLRWLARTLASGDVTKRYPVVFGCQASRNPEEMLRQIAPVVRELIPVEIPVLTPCPTATIIAAAEHLGIRVSLPKVTALVSEKARQHSIGHRTELDPPDNSTSWIEAVEHGLALSTPSCPTVICGSIYYLGEILRVFE